MMDNDPKVTTGPAAAQTVSGPQDFAAILVDTFETALTQFAFSAFPEQAKAKVDQARADLLSTLRLPKQAEGEDFPSVRDQFAMAGLQGLLAGTGNPGSTLKEDYAARCAFDLADAMMAERARRNA